MIVGKQRTVAVLRMLASLTCALLGYAFIRYRHYTASTRFLDRPGSPNNTASVRNSFIFSSRNDNYNGHSAAARLAVVLTALNDGLVEYNLTLASEVLIVDWASAEQLVRSEELGRKRYSVCIRWLYVSKTLLREQNVSSEHLSEVHALNAAARRSAGEIILRLDQDTILTPTFFNWLTVQRHFQEDFYTLLGRRDSGISERETISQDPWLYVKNETNVQNTAHWGAGTYNQAMLANGIGAVGVMIVSRKMWLSLQGYDETLTGWGHMEVELFARARNVTAASEPIGLSDLYPAIHIYHDSIAQSRPLNAWVDWEINRRSDNQDFGFGSEELPETITGSSCQVFHDLHERS